MQRGKIVCRNTIESFVNKQDWTLNGKIFEFTCEWFERFSELYNIYPAKGVSIRDWFRNIYIKDLDFAAFMWDNYAA